MLGKILITAVNAVAPLVLLILLGYFLRKRKIINAEFVHTGMKLVFHIFLPCMLFISVYSIDSIADIPWDVVIFSVIAVGVLFVLGLVTAVLTTKEPQRRGVILQASFRSNFAIIGLPLAGALGGEAALPVTAVISAFTIPLFNVLSVVALSVFSEDRSRHRHSVKSILLNIVKNPMIIGIFLGFVCLFIREAQVHTLGRTVFTLNRQTEFFYKVILNLNTITSPFALVVLGGEFEFKAARGMFREVVVGTAWRIVIAPVLGLTTAILLSRYTGLLRCGVNEYASLIALFGSPAAVASAVMAAEMHSDEQLATQIVVWSSIGSILTIFLEVCVLMGMGLL